jgi:hypothetical protein
LLGEFFQLVIGFRQLFVLAIRIAQGFLERLAVVVVTVLFQRRIDHLADTRTGPAHVGFEDLTDVHARRHAQRVQNDVDRRAVFQVRHVFERVDLGDNPLVAVTAGHLVARLQLALHRDEHLDDLHHARGQIVATLDLLDLVRDAGFDQGHRVVVRAFEGLELGHRPRRHPRRSSRDQPSTARPGTPP